MKGLIPQWLIRRHGARRMPPEVKVFSGIRNVVGRLRRGRSVECNQKITTSFVTHNKLTIECYVWLRKYEALVRGEEYVNNKAKIEIKKKNISRAHSADCHPPTAL